MLKNLLITTFLFFCFNEASKKVKFGFYDDKSKLICDGRVPISDKIPPKSKPWKFRNENSSTPKPKNPALTKLTRADKRYHDALYNRRN